MPVLPLVKVRIALHTTKRYPFLDFLQEQGYFQIENIAGEIKPELLSYFEKELSDFDGDLANVDFAVRLFKRLAPNKKTKLSDLFIGEKEVVTDEEIKSVIQNFYWKDVIEKCRDLNETISKHQARLKTLAAEEKLISPWKKLHLSLSTSLETTRTRSILFATDASAYEKLKKTLHHTSKVADVKLVSRDNSNAYAILTCLRENEAELHQTLNDFRFEETNLPLRRGTVVEELERLERASKKSHTEIKKAQTKIIELSSETRNLKIVYDYLLQQKTRQLARRQFFHSDHIAIIEGWMPTDKLAEVEDELRHLCSAEYVFEKVTLQENEVQPVALVNKGASLPFEAVTSIYGLPQANEPDPTPLLAPFFIVFFGLCLTDAGYGLSLSLICFAALKFFRIPKSNRKLFRVLGWGGITTFIAGVLFGGYFGMTPDQAPAFLTIANASGEKEFILQAINPLEGNGPLNFLILAFGFGVVQVITGIAISGWWKVRQGQVTEAILDSFLWVFTLINGILAALESMGLFSLAGIPLTLLLTGVVLLVLTQGRSAFKNFSEKNLFGKILSLVAAFGKGVLSLYDIVGHISDVLSYSRLMALGLGTGIIAYAVNIIATIVIELIPGFGIVLAILILIVGHLGNLALNALGAFIHSGRLQYVEYFGKFLEGGGTAFKPFHKKRHYTISHDEF